MPKESDVNRKNSFVLILIISFSFLSCIPPLAAYAEMKQLSEIQNGIFFISPASMEFTAKTSKTDRFVDLDQSTDFILASTTRPFVPADQNYPFSLIDNNALDSDLVILYKYDSIACSPYPAKAYLSRNNISIADYTNQKSPLPLFFNVIEGRDPYYHEKVKAIYWKITNYEITQNEWLHKSIYAGDDHYMGYLEDGYVKVISGSVSAWVRMSETHPICKPALAPCKSCLPASLIRPQPKPIELIRISSINTCISEPFIPEPPKQTCINAPPPPERTTPAATNWSYNYHNGLNFINSNNYQQDSDISPNSEPPESVYHCPTCK